jgi:hypothetical protein
MISPDRQALINAIVSNDTATFTALKDTVDQGGFCSADELALVIAVRHDRMVMLDGLLAIQPYPHQRGVSQAFIEALTLNHLQAQARLKRSISFSVNDAFRAAALEGKEDTMERLVSLGASIDRNNGVALREAAEAGHLALSARWLARMVPESTNRVSAALAVLIESITQGDMACMKEALKYADLPRQPPTAAARGIEAATNVGNLPALIFLLDHQTSAHPDHQKTVDEALIDAAEHQHVDLVRHLLPLSNPNAKKGKALTVALLHENKTLAALLAPHTDVEPVRKMLTSGAYRRWDLVIHLATLAPEDVREKWFKKNPSRFPEALALKRAEHARSEPPETLSPSRRRARP